VVVNGPADLQAYLDSPGDGELKKQIRDMLQVLRANPAAGEHMKKRLWPDSTPSRGSTTSSGTGLATR